MKVTEILAKATKPLFTLSRSPVLKGANISHLLQSHPTLSAYQPAYINIIQPSERGGVCRPAGRIGGGRWSTSGGDGCLSALIQYTFAFRWFSHILRRQSGGDREQPGGVNFWGSTTSWPCVAILRAGQKRFVPVPAGGATGPTGRADRRSEPWKYRKRR
jgi:hypothetical protein